MSQLKRISIGAATVAIVAETGLKNLMLWTLVTIGTPATTAAFVYEVVQMRQARFQKEATDRVRNSTRSTAVTGDIAEFDPKAAAQQGSSDGDTGPDTDVHHHLMAMLVARAHFVDIYGSDPETVSPVYKTMALGMLAEDEAMFVKLETEKRNDLDGYLLDLQPDESRLHVLHAQLATLVGPGLTQPDKPAPPPDLRHR
jgi:hypothetical protein